MGTNQYNRRKITTLLSAFMACTAWGQNLAGDFNVNGSSKTDTFQSRQTVTTAFPMAEVYGEVRGIDRNQHQYRRILSVDQFRWTQAL